MIWLIGNKGMLGSEVEQALASNGFSYAASDAEVDICSIEQLKKFTEGKKIEWIVNCAAYTNVDAAEDNKKTAFKINCDGVRNICMVAKELGARLIHISTDYIFDGKVSDGYCEDRIARPLSVYGESKLDGELQVEEILKSHFIIRTSWLYGHNGKNFVNTMLKLFNERDEVKVVSDQSGSPTNSQNLAGAIVAIIKSGSNKYGIYHFTDEGRISWYDFAVEIYNEAKKAGLVERDVKIVPIPTSQHPTKAKRPMNSYLLKDKIKKELGIELVDWKKALQSFINKLNS